MGDRPGIKILAGLPTLLLPCHIAKLLLDILLACFVASHGV